MAVVTRYVNTASAGGDGTTNGESGANAAYASLNAWEAAEQVDLVTAGDSHVVELSVGSGSTADVTLTTILGWTTDATHDITIRAAAGEEASTSWDATIYRLEVANSSALKILEDYVNVEELQIGKSSGNAHGQILISVYLQNASNEINISGSLLKQSGNNSYTEAGIQINDADANVNVWNSIIYGGGTYASSGNCPIVVANSTAVKVYSSTLSGGYRGLYMEAGTVTGKNVYAGNTVNADYYVVAGTMILTTCYSEDGTRSTTVAAYSTSAGAYFTNITAGSEDFSITTNSTLKDNGTDTSADAAPLNFTDDITGTARDANWDVGAFEYVAAGGGSTIPVFMKSYRDRMMGALICF